MPEEKYYLSPFLSSSSMHLITGGKFAGKSTYALQMLMPSTVEPDLNPWGGFQRVDDMPDVWYVDLTKPDGAADQHIRRLGLDSAQQLHVLTYRQILEIKPEQNRRDPLTFLDVLARIGIETGNNLPPILIVDGFAVLFMAPNRSVNQAMFEIERLQEINRTYLQHGGCLIGVQALGKNGKLPGDFETGSGTFAISSFAASVTEIKVSKEGKRQVSISSQEGLSLLALEFDARGRLQMTKPKTDDLGQPVTKQTAPAQLQRLAVTLSLEHSERMFKVKDLVDRARNELGIARRTVERWLLTCRLNGTAQQCSDRGVYQLVPPPEPPLLQ